MYSRCHYTAGKKLYGKNSSYDFPYENKPTSFAPRLKILFIFADNPTIKISMGQHHPTIAFVISYLLLAGIVKNLWIPLLFISTAFYIILTPYDIKYFAVGLFFDFCYSVILILPSGAKYSINLAI